MHGGLPGRAGEHLPGGGGESPRGPPGGGPGAPGRLPPDSGGPGRDHPDLHHGEKPAGDGSPLRGEEPGGGGLYAGGAEAVLRVSSPDRGHGWPLLCPRPPGDADRGGPLFGRVQNAAGKGRA